ncbi:Serine/threonine-protein kinase [Drechslerella dactyloides]|uniref:Serine/threonine-protein kinase n=1 Tax=Drechslerella dactyloides TaxID=74499 RepID=A0AAD6J0H2_DREDA|nr:Serine/threonine-protein kinase [Drechslerella dactyloides]
MNIATGNEPGRQSGRTRFTTMGTGGDFPEAGDRQIIGLWRLGRTLGEGGSGHVRLAKHQKTGKFAAIKIISKNLRQNTTTSITEAGLDVRQAIEREIVLMNLLTHPNVVQLYEIWDSKDDIYLVLEYVAGGDLLQYMTRTKDGLSDEEVAHVFRQIIAGLFYLHNLNIYHRDLKHENLMMDLQGNLKIADFGMAALQPEGTYFRSSCGSPNYAAPEVIRGLPYNGSTADIWSAGVILYGMLTHKFPFESEDTVTLLQGISRAEYEMPTYVSREAANLVARMLEVNPATRITLDGIFLHPFTWKGFYGQVPRLPQTPQEMAANRLKSLSGSLTAAHANMDIISKLKALWMYRDGTSLARKVISEEFSQEKLFYWLLLEKHIGDEPISSSTGENDRVLKPKGPAAQGNLRANCITHVRREQPQLFRPLPWSLHSASLPGPSPNRGNMLSSSKSRDVKFSKMERGGASSKAKEGVGTRRTSQRIVRRRNSSQPLVLGSIGHKKQAMGLHLFGMLDELKFLNPTVRASAPDRGGNLHRGRYEKPSGKEFRKGTQDAEIGRFARLQHKPSHLLGSRRVKKSQSRHAVIVQNKRSKSNPSVLPGIDEKHARSHPALELVGGLRKLEERSQVHHPDVQPSSQSESHLHRRDALVRVAGGREQKAKGAAGQKTLIGAPEKKRKLHGLITCDKGIDRYLTDRRTWQFVPRTTPAAAKINPSEQREQLTMPGRGWTDVVEGEWEEAQG